MKNWTVYSFRTVLEFCTAQLFLTIIKNKINMPYLFPPLVTQRKLYCTLNDRQHGDENVKLAVISFLI